MKRAPHAAIVLLLALAALGAGACGNREEVRTVAETEGPYLDVGHLQYQVQISRQLNPADDEDREFLEGVAPEEAALGRDETWFAIFIRVSNDGEESHPSARDFEIEDTLKQTFEPVPVRTSNPFAYRPEEIPAGGVFPPPDSAAGNHPIAGSLLLFKLPYKTLANRPLEFRIHSPRVPQTEAVVDLDV